MILSKNYQERWSSQVHNFINDFEEFVEKQRMKLAFIYVDKTGLLKLKVIRDEFLQDLVFLNKVIPVFFLWLVFLQSLW